MLKFPEHEVINILKKKKQKWANIAIERVISYYSFIKFTVINSKKKEKPGFHLNLESLKWHSTCD